MSNRNFAEELKNMLNDCKNETIKLFLTINGGKSLYIPRDLIYLGNNIYGEKSAVKSMEFNESMNTLIIDSEDRRCWFFEELSIDDKISLYNYFLNLK